MSTVTKSIGTSGRDYSTITAWEADLDNAAVYASGDIARGECYNDSVFDESVTIDGGGTVGLASVTLTVAVGQRHNGTAGNGCRIVSTGTGKYVSLAIAINITVEWIEINGGDLSNTGLVRLGAATGARTWTVQNCLLHSVSAAVSGHMTGLYSNTARGVRNVQNVMIWSVTNNHTLAGIASGINSSDGSQDGSAQNFQNITIFAVTNNNGTGAAFGAKLRNAGVVTAKNVLVTDIGGTTSGETTCFADTSHATTGTNLSTDATAPGTGSLVNKAAANQFVSTVAGSEDLHLQAGADAIDAGTDLGTTPTGVNIDIDGRDRDAEGDVWDIGADEYVNPVARFPWQVRRERRMAGAR